jgi:hypothetical protein
MTAYSVGVGTGSLNSLTLDRTSPPTIHPFHSSCAAPSFDTFLLGLSGGSPSVKKTSYVTSLGRGL